MIHCDSQAALKALDKPNICAQTVYATATFLDRLALFRDVKLAWIKAHVGIPGNKRADKLAKQGSELISNEPEPIVPVSPSQFKQDVRAEVKR